MKVRLVVYGLLAVALALSVERGAYRVNDSTEIVIVKKPQITQINPYQTEYEQMLYPTVRITAGFATGSGVVISYKLRVTSDELKPGTCNLQPETFILTAAHVVGDENTVEIETTDAHGITRINGTVVITDTDKDLALIRAQINTDKIYTAKLAPKNYEAYLFSPVWAIGCSLGLDPRPSYGHITYIETKEPKNEETKGQIFKSLSSSVFPSHFEVSAPILPGNSGGPVYDARTFEVIGIAVWVRVNGGQLVTTMAGIVPITEIYDFLEGYKMLQ